MNDRKSERDKTMFRRILVPLDGSERAERAIPLAARLARAAGGSVLLLRVVASPFEPAWQAMESPESVQNPLDADQATAAKYLAHISAAEVLAGVATSTLVFKGMPATSILSVTRSQQVDLIVLCSHGYTDVTRWALGSVAQKVAFHAPNPVLVLSEGGPAADLLPGPDTRPLRALVALDGSVRAEKGIESAAGLIAALAAPAQGALHLVRVVKPAPGDSEALGRAREYLAATAKRLREGPGAPALVGLIPAVTWSVAVDADEATALIKVAENGADVEGLAMPGGCDIIAMTTHGYSGMARWALGSITERVLKASRLPLLIVRPLDIMEKSNFTWDDTSLSPM